MIKKGRTVQKNVIVKLRNSYSAFKRCIVTFGLFPIGFEFNSLSGLGSGSGLCFRVWACTSRLALAVYNSAKTIWALAPDPINALLFKSFLIIITLAGHWSQLRITPTNLGRYSKYGYLFAVFRLRWKTKKDIYRLVISKLVKFASSLNQRWQYGTVCLNFC